MLMPRATSEGEYFWIQQWGILKGSDPDDIERQIEKARHDKAPPNAIYFGKDSPDGTPTPNHYSNEQTRAPGITGRWQTTADITDADTRLVLERNAGQPLPENEERGG
jgi:hypothetical protein